MYIWDFVAILWNKVCTARQWKDQQAVVDLTITQQLKDSHISRFTSFQMHLKVDLKLI